MIRSCIGYGSGCSYDVEVRAKGSSSGGSLQCLPIHLSSYIFAIHFIRHSGNQ